MQATRRYYDRISLGTPITERQERLYYPVINISSKTEQPLISGGAAPASYGTPEKALVTAGQLEPPQYQNDAADVTSLEDRYEQLRPQEQTAAVTLYDGTSEAENCSTLTDTSPSKVKLLRNCSTSKPSRDEAAFRKASNYSTQRMLAWEFVRNWPLFAQPKQPPDEEKKVWNLVHKGLFVLALILVVLVTAVITWAVTKSHYEKEKYQDTPMVVRGTMRFLTREAPHYRIVSKRDQEQHEGTLLPVKANTNTFCDNTRATCDRKWNAAVRDSLQSECVVPAWHRNGSWTAEDTIANYVLHNSTFCFWHGCIAMNLCCWLPPAQSDVPVISFSFTLQMRLRHKNHRLTSDDDLGAIANKLTDMLAGSKLYRVVETAVFQDFRERVSASVVCVQQILVSDEGMPCYSVERCYERHYYTSRGFDWLHDGSSDILMFAVLRQCSAALQLYALGNIQNIRERCSV